MHTSNCSHPLLCEMHTKVEQAYDVLKRMDYNEPDICLPSSPTDARSSRTIDEKTSSSQTHLCESFITDMKSHWEAFLNEHPTATATATRTATATATANQKIEQAIKAWTSIWSDKLVAKGYNAGKIIIKRHRLVVREIVRIGLDKILLHTVSKKIRFNHNNPETVPAHLKKSNDSLYFFDSLAAIHFEFALKVAEVVHKSDGNHEQTAKDVEWWQHGLGKETSKRSSNSENCNEEKEIEKNVISGDAYIFQWLLTEEVQIVSRLKRHINVKARNMKEPKKTIPRDRLVGKDLRVPKPFQRSFINILNIYQSLYEEHIQAQLQKSEAASQSTQECNLNLGIGSRQVNALINIYYPGVDPKTAYQFPICPSFDSEITHRLDQMLNITHNNNTEVAKPKTEKAVEDSTWHEEFQTHAIFKKLVGKDVEWRKLPIGMSFDNKSLVNKPPNNKSEEDKSSENENHVLLDKLTLVKHVKELSEAYQISDELEKLLSRFPPKSEKARALPPASKDPLEDPSKETIESQRHWYASDLLEEDSERGKEIMIEMARRKFVYEYASLWLSAIQFIVIWPNITVARKHIEKLVNYLFTEFPAHPGHEQRQYYSHNSLVRSQTYPCTTPAKAPPPLQFPRPTKERLEKPKLRISPSVPSSEQSSPIAKSSPSTHSRSLVLKIDKDGVPVRESPKTANEFNGIVRHSTY